MSKRRIERIKRQILSLPEITMEWTREQMFADPRVVALDEAGVIDGYMKKTDILAAVKGKTL